MRLFLAPSPRRRVSNYHQSDIQVARLVKKMLCKMYLVSPDHLKIITSNNSGTPLPPPPPKMAGKAPGAENKQSSKRRSVKNTKKKKDTVKREYDKWVNERATARRGYDKWIKVQTKLREVDVERKRQIKTVADFLKQELPSSSTSDQNIKPDFDASYSAT